MGYSRKKSLREQVIGFALKTVFCAAAAGAVGGAGYNYYGTREDVTATVTSIDGDVIRTDKGTFTNQPTWMYSKDEKETQAIAAILKPGITVKMTVYGVQPHIASFTLEDFRIYRNISKATLSPSTPAISPAAVPASPASSIPAIPEVKQEDRAAPEACAMEANPEEMMQHTPKLARDLAILANLPLTGKPVYDIVTNPANDIKACLFPVPVGHRTTNQLYRGSTHTLQITRTSSSNSYFHENFHAAQDVSDKSNSVCHLSSRDYIIADLLSEATAVAYELATEQEAENHHLLLSNSTDGFESASDNSPNRHAFNNAYNAAFKQYAGIDAEMREAKALEAGGKAVVRRLMDQEDSDWRDSYSATAVKDINNNLQFLADAGSEKKSEYQETRRDIYMKLGAVSSKINFIPEEYLGTDADKTIEKMYKAWGFYSEKVSAAMPRNFPRFS